MQNKSEQILREIGRVIVGKDEVIGRVFMAILSGGHVLLEDVPGVGKTTLALAFSRVLGLDCRRFQFTSDSMPSDIIGFSVFDRKQNEFRYQPGAAMTNLLLADEINRTSSKTQSALLEVMEEGQATVDGVTHALPDPFIVLATQNPAGSAGTQLLPASQLDRFMVRLRMGYPDFQSQVHILKDRHGANPLDQISGVVSREQLLQMREETARVRIDDSLYEYVTRLAETSRSHPQIELGLSPRGALALCRMAQAQAYLNARDYVVPEDVRSVFRDTAAHRLILSRKARISEIGEAQAAENILNETAMPDISSHAGRRL